MQYTYNPEGVCSMKMIFDIEQNVIKSLKMLEGVLEIQLEFQDL